MSRYIVFISLLLLSGILGYYFLWLYPQRYTYSTVNSIPKENEILFFFPNNQLLNEFIYNSPYTSYLVKHLPEKAHRLLPLLLQNYQDQPTWILTDFSQFDQLQIILCLSLPKERSNEVFRNLSKLFQQDFLAEQYRFEQYDILRLEEKSGKQYIHFAVAGQHLLMSFSPAYLEHSLQQSYWQYIEQVQRIYKPQHYQKEISLFFRYQLLQRYHPQIDNPLRRPPSPTTLIFARLSSQGPNWWISGQLISPSYELHDLNRWRQLRSAPLQQSDLIPDFVQHIQKVSLIVGYGNPSALPQSPPLPWIGSEMCYYISMQSVADAIAFIKLSSLSVLEEHCQRLEIPTYPRGIVFSLQEPMLSLLLAHLPKAFPNIDIYWGVVLEETASLIVSPSRQLLERWLTAYRQERTWGKNSRIVQYLRGVATEQDFCHISLPHHASRQLPLPDIHNISFQLQPQDAKIFITFHASTASENPSKDIAALEWQTIWSKPFSGIITQLHWVYNHASQQHEILLGTDQQDIHMLSQNGQLRWQQSLLSSWVAPPMEVDIYNNGKYQYLIGCQQHLHLIDRLGQKIKGYPIGIPLQSQLQYLAVVDYDGSKQYRWSVANTRSDILLLDKEGRLLEAWNPRRTKGHLTNAMRHFRHKERDYFVVALREGELWLLNRRSEPYKGFPVTTQQALIDYIIDKQQGNVHLLGEKGEIIVIDTEGKTIHTQQLPRQSNSSRFVFVEHPTQENYWIAEQSLDKLTLYSPDGKRLWQVQLSAPDDVHIQVTTQARQNYFLIVEPIAAIAYILDENGNTLGKPIEQVNLASFSPEGKASGHLHLACAHGSTLRVIRINIPTL